MLPKTLHRFVLLLLLILLAVPAAADDHARDAKADALADAVLEAMGGQDALDDTRFLRWNFFGFRTHTWDRWDGRHRLQGKTRDGESYVVLHNLNTREGRAWLNGEELTGEDLDKWLQNAYGAWINDSYWLLMPYKLKDPGVTLTYDGQEEIGGVNYDRLMLSFGDGIGLTSGDRYRAYINPETKLMDHWSYHLQSYEEDKEWTRWEWKDWTWYHSIQLAPTRVNAESGDARALENISVYGTLPESIFEKP